MNSDKVKAYIMTVQPYAAENYKTTCYSIDSEKQHRHTIDSDKHGNQYKLN